MVLDVQPGSDHHQFRRFHKAMALLCDPANSPIRGELCSANELVGCQSCLIASLTFGQEIQDAGVRSCQESFIAVLRSSQWVENP